MAEKEQDVRTKIESPWTVSFRRLKKNKMALISLVILLILSLMALFSPYVTPFHYNEGNLPAGYLPWKLTRYEFDWEMDGENLSGKYITVRPNDHTIHYLDDDSKFVFRYENKSNVSEENDAGQKRVYLSMHDQKQPSTFTLKSEKTGKYYMVNGEDFSVTEIALVDGSFFDFVKKLDAESYDAESATAVYVNGEDTLEIDFSEKSNPLFILNKLEYLLNESLKFHSVEIADNEFYTIRDDKELYKVTVVDGKIQLSDPIPPATVDKEKKYAKYEVDGNTVEVSQKKMGLKTMSTVSFNGKIHKEKAPNRRTPALEEKEVSKEVGKEVKKIQAEHKKLNRLADRKRTFAVYEINGQELYLDWSREYKEGIIEIFKDGNPLPNKRIFNKSFILGTDKIGRDIYTRLVYGGRISLSVGLIATSINVFLGLLIGSISGYYGGIVDSIIMRLTEVVMAFPFLLICITMSVILGPSIYTVMFVIGILGWPGISRMIRAQILSLREQEFMEAATALGISDKNKIVKHLWPNVMAMIIVYATLGMSGAILSEAGLSFLGLGVQPPKASWGNMLSNLTQKQLESMPWLWIPAGLAIFVTVMAFNILGDGLRDALDPKLKK